MSFMTDLMKKKEPVPANVEAMLSGGIVAIAEPEPKIEMPLVATPLDMSWPDKELELEYSRVAQKLGVNVLPRIDWRRLGDALAELMIPVYDLKAVNKYLMDKAAEAVKANGDRGWAQWFWIPMRESDVDQVRLESIRAAGQQNLGYHWNMGYDPTLVPYLKPIPLPVLLTAERIEERLPGEVSFFVSDIVSYPDPFLGVQLKADRDKTIFVVERWDEPGFRG
jgi:hypothetical protein